MNSTNAWRKFPRNSPRCAETPAVENQVNLSLLRISHRTVTSGTCKRHVKRDDLKWSNCTKYCRNSRVMWTLCYKRGHVSPTGYFHFYFPGVLFPKLPLSNYGCNLHCAFWETHPWMRSWPSMGHEYRSWGPSPNCWKTLNGPPPPWILSCCSWWYCYNFKCRFYYILENNFILKENHEISPKNKIYRNAVKSWVLQCLKIHLSWNYSVWKNVQVFREKNYTLNKTK